LPCAVKANSAGCHVITFNGETKSCEKAAVTVSTEPANMGMNLLKLRMTISFCNRIAITTQRGAPSAADNMQDIQAARHLGSRWRDTTSGKQQQQIASRTAHVISY
jgi:hypothetical protein